MMTFLSVLGGYPLVFIAMRDACAAKGGAWVREHIAGVGSGNWAKLDEERATELLLTVLLLVAVTVAAIFASDVSHPNLRSHLVWACHAVSSSHPHGRAHQVQFLISIRGASLGSIVTLVLPSLVVLSSASASKRALERVCSKALLLYGSASSVIGTAACLLER